MSHVMKHGDQLSEVTSGLVKVISPSPPYTHTPIPRAGEVSGHNIPRIIVTFVSRPGDQVSNNKFF